MLIPVRKIPNPSENALELEMWKQPVMQDIVETEKYMGSRTRVLKIDQNVWQLAHYFYTPDQK